MFWINDPTTRALNAWRRALGKFGMVYMRITQDNTKFYEYHNSSGKLEAQSINPKDILRYLSEKFLSEGEDYGYSNSTGTRVEKS